MANANGELIYSDRIYTNIIHTEVTTTSTTNQQEPPTQGGSSYVPTVPAADLSTGTVTLSGSYYAPNSNAFFRADPPGPNAGDNIYILADGEILHLRVLNTNASKTTASVENFESKQVYYLGLTGDNWSYSRKPLVAKQKAWIEQRIGELSDAIDKLVEKHNKIIVEA